MFTLFGLSEVEARADQVRYMVTGLTIVVIALAFAAVVIVSEMRVGGWFNRKKD